MPLAALALVIAAALLHALWNLVAKKAGANPQFALVTALIQTTLWAPLALALGAAELARWGWVEWAVVSASGAIHVLYFQALLKGYRVADLTVVYPVARGSGPLWSALAAVLLLGERLGPSGVAGVVGVCGGVFLIAGGPALWRAAHGSPQRQRVVAGVAWGTLTGLLIAGYTVVDAWAVKVMLMSPLLVDYIGNVLRLPLLLPLVWRDRSGFMAECRTRWKPALVVAVLGPLGYIGVLQAMTMAPLSHVAPAREMSMLFAALLGGRLLGEGDRGLRLVGALCMALGVVALALG